MTAIDMIKSYLFQIITIDLYDSNHRAILKGVKGGHVGCIEFELVVWFMNFRHPKWWRDTGRQTHHGLAWRVYNLIIYIFYT